MMRKTHLNAIIFVSVCTLALAVIIFCLLAWAVHMYSYSDKYIYLVIPITLAIAELIGGIALIRELYDSFFDEILTECDDCNSLFDPKTIEKQVAHTIYGHMHVEYRCPVCRASLT